MEYRRRLRTHPCGPVLRISFEDIMLPTVTSLGAARQEVQDELHREEFRPRKVSFVMSL
jgi:hypothetical protein